jgi:hypothetical protein
MSQIQNFVGASHGDIDKVRPALEADPTLANRACQRPVRHPAAHACGNGQGDGTRVLELLDAY